MRVALVCLDPPIGSPGGAMFNYAIRRVQAELTQPALDGVEVHLIEGTTDQLDEVTERLVRLGPDLIGGSAYVWSLPGLLEVAAAVRRERPGTRVVLGGPSARPAMFELPYYRQRAHSVDALVLGEGERLFRAIVAGGHLDAPSLGSLGGLALRDGDRWTTTGEPTTIEDLDALASPYEAGLAPRGGVGMLETFRGCPMSCAFCQWGDSGGGSRVFSTASLARDLRLLAALDPPGVQLVDAALNLNPRAFRQLVAAEAEVGLLARVPFSFEVYPAHLTDEHLRFLDRIRPGEVGVGLQSYDPSVLRQMQRRHHEPRVDEVVRLLAARGARTVVELIVGLPGDDPESFQRTLDRARELPCEIRVFHCLALPDALMTRSPAGADIRFDPVTLCVTSAAGWSERDLQATVERLASECVYATPGPQPAWTMASNEPLPAQRSGPRASLAGLAPGAVEDLDRAVREVSRGRWQVSRGEPRPGGALVSVTTGPEELRLELRPAGEGPPAFVRVGRVDVSYRGQPSPRLLAALRLMAPSLRASLEGVLGASPERRRLTVV